RRRVELGRPVISGEVRASAPVVERLPHSTVVQTVDLGPDVVRGVHPLLVMRHAIDTPRAVTEDLAVERRGREIPTDGQLLLVDAGAERGKAVEQGLAEIE